MVLPTTHDPWYSVYPVALTPYLSSTPSTAFLSTSVYPSTSPTSTTASVPKPLMQTPITLPLKPRPSASHSSTAKEYVKSRPKGHSRSLEEQARDARYDFLARVAHEQNASGVAVAHTADDQAETVLMHLIRGTGLRGLRGMFPVVETQSVSGLDMKLFRPLLSVSRHQTEHYCKALGLEPRIDHTNLLPEASRNRIRLELLPMLREYNPRFSDALLRLADSAALDLSFIESRVV